jgi:hypothetical protein
MPQHKQYARRHITDTKTNKETKKHTQKNVKSAKLNPQQIELEHLQTQQNCAQEE